MICNIILSGVGGQGILTIASIIDISALAQKLHVKQSEVHGMSQRGGAVHSHVRISENEIYSDLIPKGKADMILSVEPMELLRHIPYLKKNGWIITDSSTFENIVNYPDKYELFKQIKTNPNHIIINAKNKALEMGNSKMANLILLGAASTFLPITEESFLQSIQFYFKGKSSRMIDLNIRAFKEGKRMAKDFLEFAY